MTTTAQLVSAASAADWSSFKSLIMSATPTDIAAIGSDWNTVMGAVGEGVGNSSPAPKSLFTSTMTEFFAAAAPYLTGDSVVDALRTIADYSQGSNLDHLSVEMTAIMNTAPPSVADTASMENVSSLMNSTALAFSNQEVTPTELKNTFTALTEKFSHALDVHMIMFTTTLLATDGFSGGGPNELASVRVLLEATPVNLGALSDSEARDTFLNLVSARNNPEISPADLGRTIQVFRSLRIPLDVHTVLQGVGELVDDHGTGSDYLAAARTLLAFHPTDLASANASEVEDVLNRIASNQYNQSVTPTEFKSTIKAFLATYSGSLSVDAILSTASSIAQNDSSVAGDDHLSSVRTLLNAAPVNVAPQDTFLLRSMLDSISMNMSNPSVTAAELNSTFKAFVTHFGTVTDVAYILQAASRLAETDSFSGGNHLDSVRTLLSAHPANAADATRFDLRPVLDALTMDLNNPDAPHSDIGRTLSLFVSQYGAALDVNDILMAIGQIANFDSGSGANDFSMIRTLLNANPANAADAEYFTVSDTLNYITTNNFNAAVSDHEMAQTLTKFMAGYGSLLQAQDFANTVGFEVETQHYETAGAIVNHLTPTQFSDAGALTDPSLVQLLTPGNDAFDGTLSDTIAVFGGAGNDAIDFSASAATTARYLDGGAGKDALTGGLGDDILSGGAGGDTLTGGSGADTFRFDRAGATLDHVTDFSASQGDRIDLHDLLQDDAGLAISDYVSLQTVGSDTILSIDRDGAGTAHGFVQVAQLDNTSGLDVNDLYAQGQIIV